MSNTFIVPYKVGSESCRTLASALGIRRLKREGANWNRSGKTIINWGCSELPTRIDAESNYVINQENAVSLASNKLYTFQRLRQEGVRTVPWTNHNEVAEDWLLGDHTVYVRTTLNGHSGGGIVLVKPMDEDGNRITNIPVAPLYTK